MKHRTLPLLLLAVLAGSVSAQSVSEGNAPGNRLVGTWKVDVEIGPCFLPNPVLFFPAINTFHAGGTVMDHNWTSPTLRSVGQGIWRYVGNGQYESRFQFFRYDNAAPATASGIQEARVRITLDAGAQGYTGVVNAQQLTLDGNPVGPALCGSVVGTRLRLD